MNRWIPQAVLGLTLATASLAACAVGLVREAPKDVKLGVMAVSATPPVITMDGVADRLSPGSRIHDLNNLLVMSGALANKTVYTVYRRDNAQLVSEVWLLRQSEYEKLGGVSTSDPQGIQRFQDLLNTIWAARWLLLK